MCAVQVYKPAELLAKHGKVLGEGFASSADRAVTGVFKLTFKMASFYGLWTYLTHTFFGASVVAIPMLAAAFLAAVPLAGQYVAAAPAALELWLAEGRPAQVESRGFFANCTDSTVGCSVGWFNFIRETWRSVENCSFC